MLGVKVKYFEEVPMPLDPQFIELSQNLVVGQISPLVSGITSSQSAPAAQGIVQSSMDLIILSDLYSLQTELLDLLAGTDNIIVPNSYPAVSNRLNSIQKLVNALNINFQTIFSGVVVNNIYNGQSVFGNTIQDLLTTLTGFYLEIPPSSSSLQSAASDSASQFSDFYSYMQSLPTSFTSTEMDMINRLSIAASYLDDYAQLITLSGTSGAFPSFQAMWTQVIALKSYFQYASQSLQNVMNPVREAFDVPRQLAILTGLSGAILFLTIQNSSSSSVQTAILRQGETLQKFAERTTGNFENWSSIATINNLFPPYISSASNPYPNTATPGMRLYLPPGPIVVPTSYLNTILGTDINLGTPLADMPAWTGDLTLIAGIPNYENALVRRILTPLGTYMFDNSYGSRLPGEIGNASPINEAPRYAAYTASALKNDPRTHDVTNVIVTPVQNGGYNITAEVQPEGISSNNKTISINIPSPVGGI